MPRTPANHSQGLANPSISSPFLDTLHSAADQNGKDSPNYYVQDPKSLISKSTVHSFATGTGSTVYESLAPLLESTAHELILVTCFWAESSTLTTLNEVLRKLSSKAVRRGADKIKVRLCFSSLSIFQKLFHSQSLQGQSYPPSTWMKKLGLPSPHELGGLDLQIKSVFMLPFSIMHPKFVIIDRQVGSLPSCNISWEEWFEGAIVFSGPIVEQFLQFYTSFWDRSNSATTSADTMTRITPAQDDLNGTSTSPGQGHTETSFLSSDGTSKLHDIPTIFLPSPHRRYPNFRPFTSTDRIIAPPTPLNIFLLTVFAKAEKSIRIQTPNITSPPVLSALLKALARGIDVRILTSENLMVLEQLVTAGTTTSRCIDKLIRRYEELCNPKLSRAASDEEAAIPPPRIGNLHISYFEPLHGPKPRGKERGEPQQSHLKMTIVDDDVLILGSGNLDRASWFTSQELGVAFFNKTLAESVGRTVDEAMAGRERVVFVGRGGE